MSFPNFPVYAGALVLSVFSCAAQSPSISGGRIRAHVKYLASDLLEGRGVGERGGQLTEEYLAAQLAIAGARPAGENGTYFQTVPMVGVQTQPDAQLSGAGVKLKWQDEFVGSTHRQNASESFEADVVFVGHGIVSKPESWDDYKNTDVNGKIVVVFTNEPQPDNPEVFKGRTLTYAGRWVYKFEEAARKGALGCIIIHTNPTAGYSWEVVRNSWSKEDPQMKLEEGQTALAFAGWVTSEAAGKLLATSGHSVESLLKASDSRDFVPIPLKFKLSVRLKTKIRQIRSRNVLGMIPGSETQRVTEAVLYSAHWDHLGVALAVKGDSIYNGAIDNATGVAIVLDLAKVWGELRQKPGRSVVFAFWTAEESGLRGAEYFSRNPTMPPNRIAVNLNYDVIMPSGRSKNIVVAGAERTSVWPIVQEVAKRHDLEIAPDPRPEQGSYYRSDQFVLAKIGIPAFKIRTGAENAGGASDYNTSHYHQPSDEYDPNWDFASLEQAGRFGFLLGLNIANSPTLPRWNAGDEFAITRR